MSHIQLPIRLIYGTQISVENDTLQDLRKVFSEHKMKFRVINPVRARKLQFQLI